MNNVPIFVNDDGFNYANIRQDKTSITMRAIDGALYMYVLESYNSTLLHRLQGDNVAGAIYKFDENGASKLEKVLSVVRSKPLWNDDFIGFGDGYIYIEKFPAKYVEVSYPQKSEVVYYDLETGFTGTLLSTKEAAYMDTMFDENGYLYASIKETRGDSQNQYHVINKNELLPDMVTDPDVRSGTVLEVLQKYNDIAHLLSESQLDKAVASATKLGIEKQKCVVYPCSGGWLLHLSSSNTPLWLVSSNGTVSSVFECECMTSSSSFNLYGDSAFFSVIRYEKWDESWGYFLQPYENDSVSGTYRIDLKDLTMTKISNNVYHGIFVFDDTGIFVCDKKDGVYKLDFDGNLLETLVNPRKRT